MQFMFALVVGVFAHDRMTLNFWSSSMPGKTFAKGKPVTIRHEFATGTSLQGSAYIYPLTHALNSPRIFVYASDMCLSSVQISVDQSGRTNDVIE